MMLQKISKPFTKIHPRFGIFDIGISTLEDWRYYPKRTWSKAYHTSITMINFVKDVYLASSSERAFQRSQTQELRSHSSSFILMCAVHSSQALSVKLTTSFSS